MASRNFRALSDPRLWHAKYLQRFSVMQSCVPSEDSRARARLRRRKTR